MDVQDVTPILNVSSLEESFQAWDNQAGSTWMSWWLHSPAEVDALYALAGKLDVVAPWPPTDMPWNVRECHIRHPDGHMIRVGARLEDV